MWRKSVRDHCFWSNIYVFPILKFDLRRHQQNEVLADYKVSQWWVLQSQSNASQLTGLAIWMGLAFGASQIITFLIVGLVSERFIVLSSMLLPRLSENKLGKMIHFSIFGPHTFNILVILIHYQKQMQIQGWMIRFDFFREHISREQYL